MFLNAYFALMIVLVYVVISMGYVYFYRGETRYDNLSEYLRKGWPLTSPMNCLLYLFTKSWAKKPIIKEHKYPHLDKISKNWLIIKEEVLALHESGYLSQTNSPDSPAYYDLGFRTFYKYGWSKFYLTWYGHSLNSAKKLCPKTVKILEGIPEVKGSMISILPAGSKLTRHLDPLACSLRYHFGLSTPNSDDCYINVDGQNYSWRDGEEFIFDETYLHFAFNNSDQDRIILMCDIERPMTLPGKIINFFYQSILKLSVVPNTSEDKKGLINTIFSTLSPILGKTKEIKAQNKPLYLLIKYSVNTLLAILVFGILYLFFKLLGF